MFVSRFIDNKPSPINVVKYKSDNLDNDLAILDISEIRYYDFIYESYGPDMDLGKLRNNFTILIANTNFIGSISCSTINQAVTELYVSQNRLTDIDFVGNLPNLEIADFSRNKLETINEIRFLSLMKLREINLAHNNLQKLDLAIMEQIPMLKILDISHNVLGGVFELNLNSSIELINITDSGYSGVDLGTKQIKIGNSVDWMKNLYQIGFGQKNAVIGIVKYKLYCKILVK